jgi:hypothetical protein
MLTVWQGHCARIVETAHAPQLAECMIKGTVLLHQDNNVFRIEISTSRHWINGESLLN